MKKIQLVVCGVLVTIFALMFAACPIPVIEEITTGTVTGRAIFNNTDDNSGILITLERTDGLRSAAAVEANRAIAGGARSIDRSHSFVSQTQTMRDGSFILTNIPVGTYILYASSRDSLERAVTTTILVVANQIVNAGTLNLTPVGSITGTITVESGSPMGFLISVAGTSFMAMTDHNGNFTISGVPAGNSYRVLIMRGNFVGLWSADTVNVIGGGTTNLEPLTRNVTNTELLESTTMTIGSNGNWFINGVDTGIPAQGAPGIPGSVITIGNNGNWFINNVDTGVPAQGEPGTPGSIITIGNNGNWWIDGDDTGIPAQGMPGVPGSVITIGSNGNWFINSVDTGVPAQGEPGAPGSIITIGNNGNWWIDGDDTGIPAQGMPGINFITINVHPAAETTVIYENISGSLMVEASIFGNAVEGVTLEYQWFRNTTASNSSGTVISQETSPTFTIPTDLSVGTHYFFVGVGAGGIAMPIRSNVARVIVTPLVTVHPENEWADIYLPQTGCSLDPNNPCCIDSCTVKVTLLNFDLIDGELVRQPFSHDRPRLRHELWIGVDTWADPRNALGYRLLNSGRRLFDRVVLYSGVLAWDHLDPSADIPWNPPLHLRSWCPRNDVHLHLNDRMQWLLAGREKFIQPLVDAGMEVLICLIGGNQGICPGTIGTWPTPGGNADWNNNPDGGLRWGPWEQIGGGDNPRRFARKLVELMYEFGLHGIALHDEYCAAHGPWGLRSVTHGTGGMNFRHGENIFRWVRYFRDMSTVTCGPNFTCLQLGDPLWWIVPADHQRPGSVLSPRSRLPDNIPGGGCTACPRPNGFTVTIYSIGTPGHIPATFTMPSWRLINGNFYEIPARTWSINDIIDGLAPAQYGLWQPNVAPGTVHNSRRGAFSVAFDGAGPFLTPSHLTMPAFAADLMAGGFGHIMYFGLRQRTHYANRAFFIPGQVGSQLENWTSPWTSVLYRDGVKFHGWDYPFFPAQLGGYGSTRGLGPLFMPEPIPFGQHPRDFAGDRL